MGMGSSASKLIARSLYAVSAVSCLVSRCGASCRQGA